MQTILQIWRDGKESREGLLPGEAGVIQTLDHAARFVREDSRKADVRRFVHREILRGVRPFDERGYVDAAFRFAQREIIWRPDPVDTETLADFWSTLHGLEDCPDYKPEGDCLKKVVVMCTALACFGVRPYFCPVRQLAAQDAAKHVVCAGTFQNGEVWHRDPTPEETPPDWQAPYYERRYFPIFD